MQEQFERGAFEGKVLNQLDNITDSLKEMRDQHESLSDRLRKIELEYGKVRGFGLAIGAVAGVVGAHLAKLLPFLANLTK